MMYPAANTSVTRYEIFINWYELNTFLLCSCRYAIGRRTHVVQDIANLIIKYKLGLDPHTRGLIIREIEQCNDLGMQCDKDAWGNVLNVLRELEHGQSSLLDRRGEQGIGGADKEQ